MMLLFLNKFDANEVSTLSFKKNAFADKIFALVLVCRKQYIHIQEFFQMMQYLLATNSTAGDFNYDLLSVAKYIFRYFHRPCPDGK